jgi:hypothetical protein
MPNSSHIRYDGNFGLFNSRGVRLRPKLYGTERTEQKGYGVKQKAETSRYFLLQLLAFRSTRNKSSIMLASNNNART